MPFGHYGPPSTVKKIFIGFVRVLTDFVYKATVFDLICVLTGMEINWAEC